MRVVQAVVGVWERKGEKRGEKGEKEREKEKEKEKEKDGVSIYSIFEYVSSVKGTERRGEEEVEKRRTLEEEVISYTLPFLRCCLMFYRFCILDNFEENIPIEFGLSFFLFLPLEFFRKKIIHFNLFFFFLYRY